MNKVHAFQRTVTSTTITMIDVGSDNNLSQLITRNSSGEGDEIANVNFLYDDIVHALKI